MYVCTWKTVWHEHDSRANFVFNKNIAKHQTILHAYRSRKTLIVY